MDANSHMSLNELFKLMPNKTSNEKLKKSYDLKLPGKKKATDQTKSDASDANQSVASQIFDSNFSGQEKAPESLKDESAIRKAAYNLASTNVSKWQTIVDCNRQSDQLQFPLHNADNTLKIFDASCIRFANKLNDGAKKVSKSSLIQKTKELLCRDSSLNSKISPTTNHGSGSIQAAREQSLHHQLFDQMKKARMYEAEMNHFKNLIRNANMKNRLHRGIKSKRFRRLQRTDKLRSALANASSGASSIDGVAFPQTIVEKADALRATERYKNAKISKTKSGKRKLLQRGKFDPDVRSEVELKRQKTKEILNTKLSTEKLLISSRSLNLNDDDLLNSEKLFDDNASDVNVSSEEEDLVVVNDRNYMNKQSNSNDDIDDSDNPWLNSNNNNQQVAERQSEMPKDNVTSIEPRRDMKSKNESMSVFQAFASDDVVAHFEEEKRKELEKDEAEMNEAREQKNLPGWGSWSGPGVVKTENKNKRQQIIKKHSKLPRRDSRLSNVRINEDADRPVRNLQVDRLPLGKFRSVKEFESFTAVPLGQEWNTPQSFESLNRPHLSFAAARPCLPMRPKDYFSNIEKL
ncbi:MAG: U3 small nucleolar RNA-associated protein 14 A [Marteilia pararefringens]